jgi:hypothetical protein
VEVLEFFMKKGAPARTIEISEALGVPNSSADEILRTLAAVGYLTYNQATKLYAPSYKIVANASSIEDSFFGSGRVHEVMEDMRRETGASVFVTQQNDCWSENVAEVAGGWQARPDAAPVYPAEMVCFERNSWRPGTNFAAAMLAQQSNVDIIQRHADAEAGRWPQRADADEASGRSDCANPHARIFIVSPQRIGRRGFDRHAVAGAACRGVLRDRGGGRSAVRK